MNAMRRKDIKALKLSELQSTIEEMKAALETLRDEEQEAYDAMPESIQGSERGEQSNDWIEKMTEVVDSADSLFEALGELNGIE